MRKQIAQSSVLLATLVIAALLVGGVFQAFAAPSAEPEARPPAALYAVSWRTTGITQTTNATAVTSQAYAYQDITCAWDFYNNQRISVTMQASNDNSDWFDTHAFPPVVTDTTSATGLITRTLLYGRYTRMRFEAMTAYLVTPTCKSVLFSNWTPPAYVEAMD